jgi:hypothetical protein
MEKSERAIVDTGKPMSSLSKEEVWQEISQIVIKFSLLECDKCATTIMAWLSRNGIKGKLLRLKTRRRSEFLSRAIVGVQMNPSLKTVYTMALRSLGKYSITCRVKEYLEKIGYRIFIVQVSNL